MTSRTDPDTLAAYARDAVRYSQEWRDQPPPNDLYAMLQTHLVPGGDTADIGCGNGRDTAWLAEGGYPVTGFDASPELLDEARRLHPGLAFREASLPGLDAIDEAFDNIVCETVIMHLPAAEIASAIDSLLRILRPDGVLYLSWRVTEGADVRLPDGRLYSAFDPALVLGALDGCAVLLFEDVTSESSGKRVCRVVAVKRGDEI